MVVVSCLPGLWLRSDGNRKPANPDRGGGTQRGRRRKNPACPILLPTDATVPGEIVHTQYRQCESRDRAGPESTATTCSGSPVTPAPWPVVPRPDQPKAARSTPACPATHDAPHIARGQTGDLLDEGPRPTVIAVAEKSAPAGRSPPAAPSRQHRQACAHTGCAPDPTRHRTPDNKPARPVDAPRSAPTHRPARHGRSVPGTRSFRLRRGHYELGVDIDRRHRLPAIFTELDRGSTAENSVCFHLRNRPFLLTRLADRLCPRVEHKGLTRCRPATLCTCVMCSNECPCGP